MRVILGIAQGDGEAVFDVERGVELRASAGMKVEELAHAAGMIGKPFG